MFENWTTGVTAGIKNAQPKVVDCAFLYHDQTLQTPTNSLPGKYLTHAQSHITLSVAAMDSCLALIRPHQRGITVEPLKAVYQKPFTAEASAKE